MERTALIAEIARLERKLTSSKSAAPAKKTASRQVLAEIDELEEQIAGMMADDDDDDDCTASSRKADDDDDDDDDAEVEIEDDITADDDDDDDDDDDTAPVEDEPVTSSETAPGIEDEITQDKFSEVEKTRPAQTQTSGPSMLSVAPTNYTARLKEASFRLDRVASYLEKHGRAKLAYRIDRIADAIDSQLKQAKKSEAK